MGRDQFLVQSFWFDDPRTRAILYLFWYRVFIKLIVTLSLHSRIIIARFPVWYAPDYMYNSMFYIFMMTTYDPNYPILSSFSFHLIFE